LDGNKEVTEQNNMNIMCHDFIHIIQFCNPYIPKLKKKALKRQQKSR